MPGKGFIHSVAVAEFDELKGNTLSYIYPENPLPLITSHKTEDIAELCLPDGGHKHSFDCIYILMTGEGDVPLYGFAYFRNRPDEKEKRGARQLALLIISTRPHFDRFRPFLSVAVEQYLDMNEDRSVISELYSALGASLRRTHRLARRCYSSVSETGMYDEEGTGSPGDSEGNSGSESCGDDAQAEADNLNKSFFEGKMHKVQSNSSMGLLSSNKTCTMHLWGKMFVMQPLIPLHPNEFGGASLKALTLRFRDKTMVLWASLVSLKRVMFCSPDSNADAVGSLVLSTPLLLGPLGTLIVPNLLPYVTLANVEPVTMHASYVCGTTNGLFATKKKWFDVCADSSSGKLTWESDSPDERSLTKVMGGDLTFINRVLEGLENGRDELWVRSKFATFTLAFLDTVRALENERSSARASQFPASVSQEGGAGKPPIGPASNTLAEPTAGGGKLFSLKNQFLKKKVSKAPSDRIAQTFAGSPLWLRYRWMELNPGSVNPSRRRLSRIHAIELSSGGPGGRSIEPPLPPKRPAGWSGITEPVLPPSCTSSGSSISSISPGNRVSFSGSRSSMHSSSAASLSSASSVGSSLLARADSKTKTHLVLPPPGGSRQLAEANAARASIMFDPAAQRQTLKPVRTATRSESSTAAEADACEPALSQSSTSRKLSPGERAKWRTAVSPEGVKYWWHAETKETRWNLPGESPVRPPRSKKRLSRDSESSNSSSKSMTGQNCPQTSGAETKLAVLEAGLKQNVQRDQESHLATNLLDKKGSDSSLGSTSSWDSTESAAEPAPLYDTSLKWVFIQGKYQKVNCVVKDDVATRIRRKSDWVEAFTPKRERYYWNFVTGESAWVIPASEGFEELAPEARSSLGAKHTTTSAC